MPVPIFILVYIQELNVALGKQKSNIPIAGTLAVVTIGVGLLLIPQYLAMGAVITKIFSVTIGASVALWIFGRILKQGINLGLISSAVVTTIVGIAAAVLFREMLPMWPASILAASTSILVAFLTGLLKRSDVTMILNILRMRNKNANV